jgi:hypothetical protein
MADQEEVDHQDQEDQDEPMSSISAIKIKMLIRPNELGNFPPHTGPKRDT